MNRTYIQYTLRTLEPIKMGAQGSQRDTEYALSYIAGSSIRGAVISRLIQKEGIQDLARDPVSRKFLTHMRFFDAYIQMNNRMTIPMPLCFYADKQELKQLKARPISLKNALQDLISEEDQKMSGEQFVLADEDNIQLVTVEKTANLHITKQKKEQNIFRYEAIQKDQEFSGCIQCEEEQAELMLSLLKGEVLFVGGAKGSGYGKCLIVEAKKITPREYRRKMDINRVEADDRLTIYCLSHVIAYNEDGHIVGHLSPKLLEQKLGLNHVNLKEAYVKTVVTSGFNQKLGSRLPQVTAIQAGSILSYSYEGELHKEQIDKLEEEGFGMRKNEGFGRIIINPDFSQRHMYIYKNDEIIWTPKKQEVKEEHKALLQKIADRVTQTRIQKETQRAVIYAMANKDNQILLSKTQMGRLFTLLLQSEHKTDEEAIKQIDRFREELKKSKDQYQYSRLQQENLYDFLEKVTNKTVSFESLVKENVTNRISFDLWGIKPQLVLTNEFQKKRLYLKEVLHYIMREEENNG